MRAARAVLEGRLVGGNEFATRDVAAVRADGIFAVAMHTSRASSEDLQEDGGELATPAFAAVCVDGSLVVPTRASRAVPEDRTGGDELATCAGVV